MKCGRVQLQDRTIGRHKVVRPTTTDNPRRYCQKRLVNPQHEEDPRWIDVLKRFHCKEPANNKTVENLDLPNNRTPEEDLFLSVQTLQFKGAEQERKRPRSSFKYKLASDGNTHRMFVKQAVAGEEPHDDDCSSQLTCYYYDDYAKYISSTERSRPSSGKSTIFLQGLSTKLKANKAVQVDLSKTGNVKKTRNTENKYPNSEVNTKNGGKPVTLSEDLLEDTKILFHKSGKRKSLTISRTQSPETVQVIRVDVVCNCSTSSALSDYDEGKSRTDVVETLDKKTETSNNTDSRFTNKYLLTNTVKTLEENVSGGAKVTLLCKTFRLSDRAKMLFNRKPLDIAKLTGKLKLNK